MRIESLLDKLEAQEQQFVAAPVLAPVLKGHPVQVKIAGIVCRLQVEDHTVTGWAVLQPLSTQRAKVLRAAKRAEVTRFLQLLPKVVLRCVWREEKAPQTWYAWPCESDGRFRLQEPVPVRHCDDGLAPFDALRTRFDGRHFWFENREARRSPAQAAALRTALAAGTKAEDLAKAGLTFADREAYEFRRLAVAREAEEKLEHTTQGRIGKALAHAGGKLLEWRERGSVYSVTYRVGNRTHTSTIRKDDLTVMTSGICLSGQDANFDLTSLVGVMRESEGVFDYWD